MAAPARDIQVIAPGGTQRVEWRDDGVYLTGWAEVVFDGRWVPAIGSAMQTFHEAVGAVETFSPAEEQFNRRRRTAGLFLAPTVFLSSAVRAVRAADPGGAPHGRDHGSGGHSGSPRRCRWP